MIDYLSQNLWQVWAVIAVLCLILEMTSGDCFIICFSFGALVAAIAAAVGFNGYIQLAKGRVVETIRAGGFGRVQIDGDVWKAVSRGDTDILQNTVVTVIDRVSTIITVEVEQAS